MKFKVGDMVKVIVSNRPNGCHDDDLGAIGMIVEKPNRGESGFDLNNIYAYFVDFGEKKSFTLFGKKETCRFYRENEIELAETERNWKIVIIPDGDKTTALYYENGKVAKTEEVKRYFKDEYSVKGAVEALTKKLFNDVKPKPKFNVGDFVEVTKEYDMCPAGLRGHVERIRNNVLTINLHVRYKFTHTGGLGGDSTFYYIDERHLKKVE